jgi:hypothetical protein
VHLIQNVKNVVFFRIKHLEKLKRMVFINDVGVVLNAGKDFTI